MELLSNMATLYLIFWETAKVFCKVTGPFYIAPSNEGGLQFLHILANSYFLSFYYSHPRGCEGVCHYSFDMHFPNWTFFSCVYLLFLDPFLWSALFKSFFLNFWILFIFFYSRFLLVIHFVHISVYMSIPISQFITPPPHPHHHFSPLVSIRLFSTSVSLFLPCKPVHLYHFSRFHIHALIYVICFSLSDFLHSVWQSLDPSTSLQMTQFCSFLWLSNIPLYIYTTSLSIRLLMGI